MPTGTGAPGRAAIPARTLRTDNWRKAPLITFVAALGVGALRLRPHRLAGGLLRPARAVPDARSTRRASRPAACPESRDFGTWFGHFPALIPFAIVTLPFLLGFRLTCYYYRRSYYRAFWASPPACGVAEPHAKYTGETRFPLILQNLHRYFWLAAGVISLVNTWDVIRAFDPRGTRFGFGLGTLIMLANVVLLWAYTLSCHSCRHIVGGKLRNFSRHPLRYRAWTFVSQAQRQAHAAGLDHPRRR